MNTIQRRIRRMNPLSFIREAKQFIDGLAKLYLIERGVLVPVRVKKR